MKRNQSGFTLIEIAIVVTIVGLLLTGILKGQALINSSKIKNLAVDFKNIPAYIYGYQDKFKSTPGDDANVAYHITGGTVCTPSVLGKCTPANGIIDGNWNATDVGSESFLFWQHIRLAGLAPGSTDTAAIDYIPKNTVGGNIGITSSGINVPIIGMKGEYIICSDNILGKFVKQLDITLDDGNTATGSMMVTATGTSSGGTPIATTDIIDDQTYLVCMSE